MGYVNNVHDRRWVDDDTPGARGYEYIKIMADDSEYTSAFSCELVRLGPGDHSGTSEHRDADLNRVRPAARARVIGRAA
jgi:hypothetical protein